MHDLNEREEGIFNEARHYSDSEKRLAYLEIACHGDKALQQRIERLVSAGARATNFFGQPAANDLDESWTEASSPLSEGPGSEIGRYKILQQIGEGGMGAVFMAEQTEPIVRKVALKIIKLGMDTRQVVARFEAERQALAMMDHPNIAKVLDAGATETGRPFFVMELVRGVSISEYCKKNRLGKVERLGLFTSVCQAIQHAHQKGVIHRDIKPSNVLITLNDGVPHPMVIDFGIAKATNQKLTDKTLFTNYAQMIGTPAYMSPEQAEMSKLDVDTRTDVYSLGVLLYELLTGTTPFPAKELMSKGYGEMQRIITEQEPEKPSTRARATVESMASVQPGKRTTGTPPLQDLKGDLDWIVMKCLEKDRTHRYETVNGLVADVERHLNDEPVTAAAPTFAYQFRKFYRRNRAYLQAAAVVAGLLVLSTAFSVYQAARATKQKNVAIGERQQKEMAREKLSQEKEKVEDALEAEHKALEIADGQKRQAQLQRYVSDMRLAHAELTDENLGSVRKLLDRHRPSEHGPDFRGWEWRWLWSKSRGNALFQLCQAQAKITCLSASRDGKWLAFVDRHTNFEMWDVERQEQVFLPGPDVQVLDVSFPQHHSKFAILCRSLESPEAQEIQIRSTRNREIERTLALPRQSSQGWIRYSADGQFLVGLLGADVFLWESATGELRSSHPIAQSNGQRSFPWALTSDASLIAQGVGRSIVVHDLGSGEEMWSETVPEGIVSSLAFSHDDAILASGRGGEGQNIRFWEASNGSILNELGGHRMGVTDLKFSPDGETLISASNDQTIRVWDLATRREKWRFRGQGSGVVRIALLSKTGRIAGAGQNGSVTIWDLDQGEEDQAELIGPHQIQAYRFHDGGKNLWIVNRSGDVREWETGTRKATDWSRDLHQIVEFAIFSSNGDRLATQSEEGLFVWDMQSETDPQQILLSGGVLKPLGFVDDEERLVVIQAFEGGNQRLVEWDLTLNKESHSWRVSTGIHSNELRRRPSYLLIDGGAAMFGPHDGAYQRIDRTTGLRALVLSSEMVNFPAARMHSSSFSTDQRHAALVYNIGCMLFSSDSKFRSGTIQTKKIDEFSGGLHGVAFSPDSQLLAIGSSGTEAIKLWRLDAQEQVLTLQGEGSVFLNLSYSPDGNCIAATSNYKGKSLHLWRAPSWDEIEVVEAKPEKDKAVRHSTPLSLNGTP